jgi:outer membrane protein assembly factor BamB
MPSTNPTSRQRRRFLAGLGASVFALAGCVGREEPEADPGTERTPTPDTTTPEPSPSDTPVSQPDGWPQRFGGNVLSVDADGEELFAVVGGGSEPDSRMVSLTPDGSVRWETPFEANEHGHGPDEPHEGDGGWGTWVTDDTVYLAAGMRHERWTVRAFARADGDVRWSYEAERQLAIRDVTADSLLVTAEEIFVPEHSHDTPEDPLVSELSLLDRETGEATALGSLDAVRAATLRDGDAYAIAGSQVVALDGTGGSRWRYDLPGEGTELHPTADGVLAVANNDGMVGGEARVVGIGPDGDRLWRHDVPAAFDNDVLFADGTLFAGGAAGVAAVRADGTLAWRDDRAGGWPVYDADTGRLYTRSGKSAGATTAYGPDGSRRWTFDPPSTNAWAAGVTDDAVLATAITGDNADEPFYTMYAVDPETGEGGELVQLDSIFAVEPVGSRVYVAAGSQIHAFEPSPGA